MTDLSSDLASLRIDRGDSGPGGPSWTRRVGALVAIAGLGVAGYVFGWPLLEAQIFRSEVEATEIGTVSPAQAAVTLTATGYVVAETASRVAPKLPGRVKAVFVKQGQKVTAGTPLFELDPTDEQASIAAARSRSAAAQARALGSRALIETAEAQIAEVQQQAARERALANQGVAPVSGAEDLEARVQSLRKAKAAAEASAKAAVAEASALSAEVNVLTTSLGNLTLTAPISGTVMNKPPEVGEFVGPQPAGVSVDMGGIELADFASLVVEADIPEQRLHQVAIGGPTEIVLDAFPDKRLRGVAKEITPKVDRAKATVTVKVGFSDAFDRAMPDMSARVSFLSQALDAKAIQAPPKVVVPGAAIAERGGGKVVFVLEGDRVRMVPIEVGPALGTGFELVKGPASGTRLVKNPEATLTDGKRIKEKVSE
ncbi:MAG: hypothetical protein RJA70_869 [Pseudomonadota bacterium]|jgi:RND family efflux transporter MFP subunit